MRKLFYILLLSSFFVRSNTPVFDDKAAHWWVAFGLTAVSTEITYQLTDKVGLSVCVGGITGEGATIGKELIYDGYLKKGVKSLSDGIAGTMGTFTGMMVMTVRFNLQRKKRYNYDLKDYERKYQ
jgi:hypothetical protein